LIKVNKKDGKTLSFDLEKDAEYIDIQKKLDDDVFIGEITGINSLFNTFWHALTLPKNFRNVTYGVEKVKHFKNGIEQTIGEKIVCHADDVRLTILVYYNTCPKMARIELKKVGKQRFIPKRSTAHGVD
jgi:hypothetical protein